MYTFCTKPYDIYGMSRYGLTYQIKMSKIMYEYKTIVTSYEDGWMNKRTTRAYK